MRQFGVGDTVLIAAVFCLFNRYVDGAGHDLRNDEAMHREAGKVVAQDRDP